MFIAKGPDNTIDGENLRYEFPTTEKVRLWLRLDSLFRQFEWFVSQDNFHCHEAAIQTYFAIQDVTQRGDQKGDLIKELDRYTSVLSQLKSNEEVDQESLGELLEQIRKGISDLQNLGVRISHLSLGNEFLRSIGQRSGIPAGCCEFDLPSYHHWLNFPPSVRKKDLSEWTDSLRIYQNAVTLVLEILRGSAEQHVDLTAHGRSFEMPAQGKIFPLVQVFVDPSFGFVPKVSCNKYMLSIRFVPSGLHDAKEQLSDVPFSLRLCAI